MVCRIKDKLKSGEIAVTGDQWPIFLYAGYSYDQDDPWNGLLRSNLLVSVSSQVFSCAILSLMLDTFRLLNMCLHRRALSKRSPKRLAPETLIFMV